VIILSDTKVEKQGRKGKETFFRSRVFCRFKKHKLAVLGFIILSGLILIAIFAPYLTPYKQNTIDLSKTLASPSREHLLGTDKIGRDFLTRLIYGSRVSLVVGLGGVFVAGFIGIILGSISGYMGGKTDIVLLKLSEIIMCFPRLILVLILVTIAGQSIRNIILTFGFLGWVSLYRLVRSLFFSLREEEFVEALKAFGVGKFSIMFRHILPNTLAPVIVWITLTLAGMILQEAGLSFLGLGVPSNTPSWGNLLNAAQELKILRDKPLLWIAPGLMISLAVLSANFLVDGLRDALDSN
jgi:peptide/nickel transport system permease protein